MFFTLPYFLLVFACLLTLLVVTLLLCLVILILLVVIVVLIVLLVHYNHLQQYFNLIYNRIFKHLIMKLNTYVSAYRQKCH